MKTRNAPPAREIGQTFTTAYFDLKNKRVFWELYEEGETPDEKRPIMEHIFTLHEDFLSAYRDALIYGQWYYLDVKWNRPVTITF